MLQRRTVDREELSWAAGFFDGEGCFSLVRNFRYPTVRIAQAEREPLERFQAAVGGIGKVYGPYAPRHKDTWSRKPQYSYQITGVRGSRPSHRRDALVQAGILKT
jgi:hypothetical protein